MREWIGYTNLPSLPLYLSNPHFLWRLRNLVLLYYYLVASQVKKVTFRGGQPRKPIRPYKPVRLHRKRQQIR